MINNISLAISAIQSRFAPLPFKLHILFCVLSTILFLILYLRSKNIKEIYWLLICDTTVILQFYGDKITAIGVAICEIVLFALLGYEVFRQKKEKKNSEKSESEKIDDNIKEIEKLVKSENKAMPDENKIDVIGDAFEVDSND